MYLVCKLYLKYLIEKKGKKEKKYNTIGKLREYFAMPLISSKLQNSPSPPPAHETKMHQCLPYYLRYTCIVEAYKYDKNQDFEKVEDKHTAQRS